MDPSARNSSDTIGPNAVAAASRGPPATFNLSPFSLLPTELLLQVLSLCETSSRLPATGRACADLFKPGQQPHRIWTHRHVFLNPEYDHVTAHDGQEFNPLIYGSQQVNEWYTRVAQIESRLAYYLKARAPVPAEGEHNPLAAGIAPPVSDLGSPNPAIPSVLSGRFVDWLFSRSGPFACRNGVKQLAVIAESDSVHSPSSTQVVSPTRTSNWRLLPDALLLVHFFIRTTQLDLLESALLQLRSALPTLATTSAPLSIWAHYMLDNRPHLRSVLRAVVINTSNAPISYPTFLCLLSLIDWSKPALNVISRAFSDSIDLPTTINTIASNSDMVQCMVSTLHLLTCPSSSSARVIEILDLFRRCNAPLKYELVPTLSHNITSNYSIFADVFRFYDLPNLPRMAGNPVRHILGLAVANWVSEGNTDLLKVALEHGLFDEKALGRVLQYAASQQDMDLVDCLAQRNLPAIVGYALKHASFHEPTVPNAFPILFNLLITYSHLHDDLPNPTDLLIGLSRHWTSTVLSFALFDLPQRGLRFSWDYPRYLRAQLKWATSHTAYKSVGSTYAMLLGRLIDQCTAEGSDWVSLEFEYLAVACAIRLIALCRSMLPVESEAVDEDACAARRLDPVQQAAVARLAKVTVARMREAAMAQGEGQGAENDDKSVARFTSSIPASHLYALHDAVACDASHSNQDERDDSALSVFLDTLIALDRKFVLNSISWAKLATVRYWTRFTAAEIASRIDSKCALALVRSAIADSGDTDNVDTLAGLFKAFPSEVREAEAFVRGLCEGMNRRPMFRSKISDGIWKAGWKDWPAQMARFALSLDDGAEEDDSDCEGYEFSPFD